MYESYKRNLEIWNELSAPRLHEFFKNLIKYHKENLTYGKDAIRDCVINDILSGKIEAPSWLKYCENKEIFLDTARPYYLHTRFFDDGSHRLRANAYPR